MTQWRRPLEVQLPPQVMRMLVDCLKSGIYGETMDEVVLSILRPGLLNAVNAGITQLKE